MKRKRLIQLGTLSLILGAGLVIFSEVNNFASADVINPSNAIIGTMECVFLGGVALMTLGILAFAFVATKKDK